MPTTTKIFLGRLVGAGVFDPNGDQVGKVKDFVVALRTSSAPRALGLIVEVQPRRRIFVPITRLQGVESGQIIVTGVVNLRRFEQRPNETLVIGELFDRRITLVGSPDVVTIMDAAIEQNRSHDWELTSVFVRRGGGGLRRRGESWTVPWSETVGISLPEAAQGAEHLLATLENLRPADLANALQDLPLKRRLEVARQLDDERLADVLEEMSEDDRVEVLQLLEADRAADVLEEMDPDDAADIMLELPREKAEELLDRMEPEEAEDIRRLMTYGDYTAGGMMTSEPLVLPPDATVAEALARIRNPELSPSLAAQVYVTRAPLETPTGKYLGVCHFQRLLREPPGTLVSAVLDRELEPIGPQASLGQVARYFATYNLVALPVVDEDDHLLGTVTVDDLVDHMLPENWRDSDIEGDSLNGE